MRPTVVIEEATTPDGSTLRLSEHDGSFEVSLEGATLMASSEHHSESLMAELACQGLGDLAGARVLVGGLGIGYTLRAALDRLGPDATVVVVELMEAVVRWNRGPLAPFADRPLEDPRTHCVTADLVAFLAAKPEPFDAILIDVDNGPEAFTTAGNERLYDARGLERLRRALRPGGTLVIWSAFASPDFCEDMRRAALEPEIVNTRSRGCKGSRHTLYVGRRPR